VRANPREVAIIQDRGCASSCEGFVLRARQSRKVTTYGTNTSGIHDYGNVRESKAPCGTLVLRHPTTRAGYMPEGAIDNVGIPPQVAIPATEVFPVDWVLRRMAERQASR
jgi:C-terminal processing protease CtpA/Prc